MKRVIIFSPAFLALFLFTTVSASDWPIYKGNIFYTGNNDEITVKNNNLKWLFQASDTVFNPIISDGMVFMIDRKKNIYCLDEDKGKLIWKVNLKKISSQFHAKSKALGKIKYPLVKGNRLFITDSYVIYCMDKRSGRVIWARTGMREEKELLDRKSRQSTMTNKYIHGDRSRYDPTLTSQALVDGIYSDPVIHEDTIYYGTRNVFMSREIVHGRFRWNNKEIKSFSGFPSFYDRFIFTQSMDYGTNRFSLYCMDADTGAVIWQKRISKPLKIYSPVVYRRRVYLAVSKSIHCFDLRNGEKLWERQYDDYITSNPSFTEQEILFTVGNRKVVLINPDSGSVVKNIDLGKKSSPHFVTIRNQIYIANTFKKKVGGRELSYASLKALKFDRSRLWEFIPPFPGGAYQPAASKGIMFLPAGNYLYAVGTDYYPRVVDGGDGHYGPYDDSAEDKDQKSRDDRSKDLKDRKDRKHDDTKRKEEPIKKLNMRRMNISVTDKDKSAIDATVEIKKWDRGKEIYSKKVRINRANQEIEVPDADDVEITADSEGYIPKKVIISRKDKDKSISLERIEKGKGIVVDNIYFEINEAYLRKESLNILDTMIASMRKNPRIKLEVRGHSDSTGTHEHNMKLSGRRADAVRDYMIKNGISPERLTSKGFGPDKPIASNKTAGGRSKNRRTEFFILDK